MGDNPCHKMQVGGHYNLFDAFCQSVCPPTCPPNYVPNLRMCDIQCKPRYDDMEVLS